MLYPDKSPARWGNYQHLFSVAGFGWEFKYDAFRIQIRILIDGLLLIYTRRYVSMSVIWKDAHGPIAARWTPMHVKSATFSKP